MRIPIQRLALSLIVSERNSLQTRIMRPQSNRSKGNQRAQPKIKIL